MTSNFGNCLKISIFGESHARGIGMTIDGLPAGITIDENEIAKQMELRHGIKEISTQRREEDKVEFISGLFEGHTTGTPLSFVIFNKDVNSSSYKKGEVRPSHADLPNYVKSNGFNDYRGGGFSSGRITASFTVLGTICKQILANHNIKVCSRILSIHDIKDDEPKEHIKNYCDKLLNSLFPTISDTKQKLMMDEIEKAKQSQDSVGGIIESYILGLPVGLGEPYFDSLESFISHLLFSIGGVKGVEFGDGFDLTKKFGSEVNDGVRFVNGDIEFTSNHNGGINGGLSNGNTLLIKTAIKPTPSISKEQQTINIETKSNETISTKGRHDPCFVPRVVPVINAVLSYAIVDMLMQKESKNI